MIDRNSQFMAILTNVGAAKLANANALGIPWNLTALGVGDANGTDPIPGATQTKLINEQRRAPLNQLRVDPVNAAVIIAEQVIPADVGGWWIREIGLYDADGDLVAVASCAPSFKPALDQGSGRTQIVRMNFVVASTNNIVLKIDPAVVLATREYVDLKIAEELNKQDFKHSVLVATTAAIVLSGAQSIDGVAVVAGDRVLVKDQATGKTNGIYVASAGAWARSGDADSSAEVTPGLFVFVEKGASNADSIWQLTTDAPIVLGTTDLVFKPAGGASGLPYALDTGAANAYVASYYPALTALTDGLLVGFKAKTANAGASTFNPGALGAKPIVGGAHAALQGGEIVAAGNVLLQYNTSIGAGSWVLIASTGGGEQVAPATKGLHAVNAAQLQSQDLTAFSVAGASPALTLTPVPAIPAYAANQRFRVRFASNSLFVANTLNVSGLGPKALKQYTSAGAKVDAVFAVGQLTDVEYDGTDFILLNQLPAVVQPSNLVGIQGMAKKLTLSASGTSALVAVGADELVVESSANAFQVLRSVAVSLSTAVVGVNGLDSGAIANSTWYSVWVIWNGSTIAGVLSLSATDPVMPAGYTHKARVSWIRTDASAANKYPLSFKQSGRTVKYVVAPGSNVTTLPILISGTQGALTPTFVAASIVNFVPVTATKVSVQLTSPSGLWAIASPNGSVPNTVAALQISNAAGTQTTLSADFFIETQQVFYAASGTCALYAAGWEDGL